MSSILLFVERDTPCTAILLAVEMDTPCTFILLAVERDLPCTSMMGCGNGYTLQVHTAGVGNGERDAHCQVHVQTACGGK